MRHPNVRNADEVEVREMIKGEIEQLVTSRCLGRIAAGKNAILLAPVPRRMSALTRQKSTLFQWLAVALWVPAG